MSKPCTHVILSMIEKFAIRREKKPHVFLILSHSTSTEKYTKLGEPNHFTCVYFDELFSSQSSLSFAIKPDSGDKL